jgi:pilus assembly protein CpaE
MPPSGAFGPKIHVLIVDDIAETRENVKKLLYFEDDIDIVGTAADGREGVDLAVKLNPDIVLMDINMPGMDGIAASEAISAQAPNVQVVMMSVQGEADYLRRSMLAGAREFLIKPFSGDELVNSIHRVHQFAATRRVATPPPPATPTVAAPPPPLTGGKVIAVFGSKGGAGSSTLAVNLAIALREETKERVALVDANFEFGDIGVFLNLPGNRTIAEMTGDKTEIDEDLLDGTLASHTSGIKVLLAPARPELAELVKVEHMKRIMDLLHNSFDYIVVDLWKSFHDATLLFLDVSDQIVLVSTSDIPAIKNAKMFFELTDALGYPLDKTFFVLNREDGRSGISVKDIEMSIKHPVGIALPKDERTSTLALNRGVPFVLSQRKVPLAQAYYAMTRTLVQRLAAVRQAATAAAKPVRK